jgi:signal transduction histidine kinase
LTQRTAPPFPEISPRLQAMLQQIVDDIVERLDCAGALMATLEQGNALLVRACALRLPPGQRRPWEQEIGLKLKGPKTAVYLDKRAHQQNLGARAVQAAKTQPPSHLTATHLYDLFRPLVKKPLADTIQAQLDIRQVIAFPFLLDSEVAGTLLVAARQPIAQREVDFLTAFGRQAANAIQSERHLTAVEALGRVTLSLQSNMADETAVLQTVVNAVVKELGYAGAMVATLEAGNALPIRAYAVDTAETIIQELEVRAGVSLLGPQAVVYLDDERYRDNISVQAIKGIDGRSQTYLTSPCLYDLLRPVTSRPLAELAQRLMGIRQVIAVPFFIGDQPTGNLFVASRKATLSDREIGLLTAFSQQAALGIHNARLYHAAEEQRKIAQIFGRMAFSATASVHALRNHIGATLTYLRVLEMQSHFSAEQRQETLAELPLILERLSSLTSILDNLHEPWQANVDASSSAAECVLRAVREVFPGDVFTPDQTTVNTRSGVTVHLRIAPDLPPVATDPGMLSEAFRVLLKNAADALPPEREQREVWISGRWQADGRLAFTIRDSGQGIRPEHLDKIFDMGWSTKNGQGMGFGLFWTRDYINGLGGSIQVESGWQEGAAFHIYLPVIGQAGSRRPAKESL